MTLFNGEEMRRKLEENLQRLQVESQLQATIPATEQPLNEPRDAQEKKN